MKHHAIIPIFIPHRGCPNDCVFCNQKIITARQNDTTPNDAKTIIDTWLGTIREMDLDTVEVAFFGGSFTGIPIEEQSAFLKVAKEYKDRGDIDKIHLSTRPDYINEEILDNLQRYGTDTIELGCQSFDNEVLALSKRGHDEAAIYRACGLIKERGLELGIQLMIGLPGDTSEKAVASAKKAAAIVPELSRLYPTVILPGTELAEMFKSGRFKPFSERQMIETTAAMYRILMEAGVTIMRVGLKSTDLITGETDLGGDYHPAFRQLAEGLIAREDMTELTENLRPGSYRSFTFSANSHWFNAMIGHKAVNKHYFSERYPKTQIRYTIDDSLNDGQITLSAEENTTEEAK